MHLFYFLLIAKLFGGENKDIHRNPRLTYSTKALPQSLKIDLNGKKNVR